MANDPTCWCRPFPSRAQQPRTRDPMPDVAPRPYPLPPLPPNTFYVDGPDPASAGDGALVIIEDSDPFDRYTYRASRVLYQGRTAFQNVLIADTYNYGLTLFLDGS